jgi:hypothetical protein
MINEGNKNQLLILFNNYDKVEQFIIEIKKVIHEPYFENLVIKLINDIKGILRFFPTESDNEEKYIIGIIYCSKLVDANSNSNFNLELISKWNLLSESYKEDLLKIIKYKGPRNQISSFEYLHELNSNALILNEHKDKLFITLESFLLEFLNKVFLFENDQIRSDLYEKIKINISSSKVNSRKINIDEYKNNFLKEFLKDIDANKLALENPDSIKELILESEQKIIKFNPELVLKFLNVFSFIEKQYKVIEKSITLLKSENEVEMINNWVEAIRTQVGSYNIAYLNTVGMISAFASDKMVHFYELYQEFETLGLFNTAYEKGVLDSLQAIENEVINLNENISIGYLMIERKLNNIINGISSLNHAMNENIRAIHYLEKTIVSSFQSLEKSISSNTSDLAKSINGHLINIDSKIGFNNLLSVVSAYQLYKINKQTKPLLPK